ncbi:MAG: stringent starvation protein A [Gammaproteobacteria bacterium]|nr:stringent starvation protein A [Gammaproteobacteria bacterium]
MTNVSNRRSMMGLFSGNTCIRSHQVRFVLREKGITTDIQNVGGKKVPEDLIALNPYASIPTLTDRELVIYDSGVIIEYLDERYPHPPLMPVSPVDRAKVRLALVSLEADIVSTAIQLDAELGTKNENSLRKKLKSMLNASLDLFSSNKYFLNDELTVIDCVLAPILWRLEYFGISLGKEQKAITDYMERVFSRETFQDSLSEDEEEMHL